MSVLGLYLSSFHSFNFNESKVSLWTYSKSNQFVKTSCNKNQNILSWGLNQYASFWYFWAGKSRFHFTFNVVQNIFNLTRGLLQTPALRCPLPPPMIYALEWITFQKMFHPGPYTPHSNHQGGRRLGSLFTCLTHSGYGHAWSQQVYPVWRNCLSPKPWLGIHGQITVLI